MHKRAKVELEELRRQKQAVVEKLLGVFGEILQANQFTGEQADLGRLVQQIIEAGGGNQVLLEEYLALQRYNAGNYYPLLPKFYSSHRQVLFELLEVLTISSTSQDKSVELALKFIQAHKADKTDLLLPADLDLSFASQLWQTLLVGNKEGVRYLHQTNLEICVFSVLASEFKSADMTVAGSERYAALGENLLPWAECESRLPEFCQAVGRPTNATQLVAGLKAELGLYHNRNRKSR